MDGSLDSSEIHIQTITTTKSTSTLVIYHNITNYTNHYTEKHHLYTKLQVTIQSRILDLIWITTKPEDKNPPPSVFAITADLDGYPGGPLWHSDYYGRADSWKDATPLLQAALPSNETATHIGVVALHWHESKPSQILFQGRGRWNWITSDSGTTFTAVRTPGNAIGFVQEIKTHPHQAEWLLAKARRDVCLTDPKSPFCGSDLFVSKDYGRSWNNLTAASNGKVTSVRDFEWGAKLEKYAKSKTPDEAIFATVYLGGAAHKGLYPGWDKDLHYVVSLDLFHSSFAKIIACGNLFEVVASKVFLAVPSECPVGPDGKARKKGGSSIASRSVTLYVSDHDGDDFVEACLPVNLEDDGYNIVHTHDEAAAFILADHAEPGSWGPTSDSPTSDAYAPAYNASLHTLSLSEVYRRDYVTDFGRVEGLPVGFDFYFIIISVQFSIWHCCCVANSELQTRSGTPYTTYIYIYILSTFLHIYYTNQQQQQYQGVFIANQVDPSFHSPAARGREANYLRTQISLTGGSSWQFLAPPANYRFGQCNTCPPGSEVPRCSLHLHGPTSWYAPEGPHPNFYSLPTAPGLIIATGNVGPHLDQSPDGDCTWMSRDGGLSWEDIADNTAIYEIGNHGGIVVIAAHRSEGPTDTVKFSLDQGACFHTVKLPEPLLVENIRISPGGTSTVFVVHGLACLKTEMHPQCGFAGGSAPPGKMYSIDVKDILGGDWKECDTSTGSKDYVTQEVPSEGACLLGAKRITRQRNRDSFCANPLGWEPGLEIKESCQCGVKDVECEFGYEKNATSGACIEIKDLKPDDVCPVRASLYRFLYRIFVLSCI